MTRTRPTRRNLVKGALATLPAATLLPACGDGESGSDASGSGGTGSGGTSGSGGAGEPGACTLYPQQTQGPFYISAELLREDITEGKAGLPLSLVIDVVSASSCEPLAGVAVDVWHCDAEGVYSAFAGQLGGLDTTGETFLRGTQLTDDDGSARFTTIYPGWYPGRTTHIHFKVHLSETTEAVSQLYFPEDVTALVYAAAPYDARGPKDTTNLADSVDRGMTPLVVITELDDGYEARLTVTVAG